MITTWNIIAAAYCILAIAWRKRESKFGGAGNQTQVLRVAKQSFGTGFFSSQLEPIDSSGLSEDTRNHDHNGCHKLALKY
mmetsp:Transcript_74414/g.198867  ORF Transcript_74414/g.198867 Transcript_74414/m.198867 type:complete len:80 (+) Transcript_74414:572-811(+)